MIKSPRKPLSNASASPSKESFGNDEEQIIVWTNRNLKYIFKRMFEFSIDLPFNSYSDFESFTILDEEKMCEANPNLKKQLDDPSM
jgi:hypothetical protein